MNPLVPILALCVASVGQPAWAAVLEVGPGAPFKTIADAVGAAKPNDEVRVEAGLYLDESIIVSIPLTIVGVGGRPVLKATDMIANGQAMIVTRADVTIRNFAFRDAVVVNGNGAGIRHDHGNLLVEDCVFRNDEDGILIGEDHDAEVVVLDSHFIRDGAGDGHTHGIYAGAEIASLTVRGSTFIGTVIGHHLKSRARYTEVTDNLFGDGVTGTTSYAIDVPDGGRAIIRNNKIVQEPQSDSHIMVAYALESLSYPENSLLIENNTFIGHRLLSIGVRNGAADVQAVLRGNVFQNVTMRLLGHGDIEPAAAPSGTQDLVATGAADPVEKRTDP